MLDPEKTYWTCEPSIEATGYGNSSAIIPYCVKITDKLSPFRYSVSSFNRETGQLDTDSNASAIVKEEELFSSEKEAWKYFLQCKNDELSDLHDQIQKLTQDIEKWNRFLFE